MNDNELKLHFPHQDNDDFKELFEQYLFEYKLFFTSKPIISKVFSPKIKKLNKLVEAYIKLSKSDDFSLLAGKDLQLNNSNVILSSFEDYHFNKNNLKRDILNTENPLELMFYVEQLLLLHSNYISKWPTIEIEDEVSISKDSDPMLINQSIKQFQNENGIYFSDLIEIANKCPKILLLESKRLSLLRNIEKNG